MRNIAFTKLLLAAALMPCAGYGSSYFLVTTDHVSAQTQLDVAHDRYWEFNPVWNWEIGGGVFTIKRGPSTSVDAVLSLYQGGTTGSALATVSVSPAAVDNSYAPVEFLFSSPVTLLAGSSYTLVLTSAAPDNGSHQYFIKGRENNFEDFAFEDDGGNPLPETDPNGPGEPAQAATPEPGTLVLVGCGAAAVYIGRFRR